jgi:hypothetical protein
MLLWFIVTAPVLVAEVFRSPMVDYRLVAVGALAPMVEVVTGTFLGLHTLVAPVVVLGAVMAATQGRRLVRRRLLGVPVGMFCHLLLDGTWLRADLFWWPSLGPAGIWSLVEEGRSPLWSIAMELAGAALGVWAWRRYALGDRANRALLVQRGHLARDVLS